MLRPRRHAKSILAWIALTLTAADSPGATPLEVPTLPEIATSRLDPRLRMWLAHSSARPTVLRHAPSSWPDRRGIQVARGEGLDLTFPVIVRTSLSDERLQQQGLRIGTRVGSLVTGRIDGRELIVLASDPGVEAIEGAYSLSPALDVSIPEIRADQINSVPYGFTGRGVLVGFLDSGIDHSHEDFKRPDGTTRIRFIWDQWGFGTPPPGFSYGREYTAAQIDAGQANGFDDYSGHGTHVSGIAVGDGSSLSGHPFRGVAWEADLIHVRNAGCDLFCYGGGSPAYGPPSTVGSIDGVAYMVQRARSLGMPLVINQSQAVAMGPHDGTTLFEQAYDEMIATENVSIVVAAGNMQALGAHGRANVPVIGYGSVNLDVSDEPGGGPPVLSIFECWYDEGLACSFRITTPSDDVVEIPTSSNGGVVTSHADSLYFCSTPSHPVNGQGNLNVFALNRGSGIERGRWIVGAHSENGGTGFLDLYCERNQPGLRVPESEAVLVGNVGMPGSCNSAISVAAYNTRFGWISQAGPVQFPDGNPIGDIATSSSHGPRRDGAPKPDLGAPGLWVLSSRGSDGFFPSSHIESRGRHVAMEGTSMAAPHVTGTIALMLDKDPTLRHDTIKEILLETARKDAFTGSDEFDPAFGAGKIDALASVRAVGRAATCIDCSRPLALDVDVFDDASGTARSEVLPQHPGLPAHDATNARSSHIRSGLFASPNPTTRETGLRYATASSGSVRITVFDTQGRVVRTIWNGWQMAGGHHVVWDGMDDAGHRVESGSYLVRVQTPYGSESGRVAVLR